MARKNLQPADDEDDVPAWIVSFSDMVTLLLAFFVLLQAFATEKSPDLFYAGRGSFERAIHGMGIPDLLLGRRNSDQKDWRRIKYPMPEDDRKIRREVRDYDEDRMRELFNQMRQNSFALEAMNVEATVRNSYPTSVFFSGHGTILDEPSQAELDRVCRQFEQYVNEDGIRIYILVFCPDIADFDQRIMVGSRRGQAIEGHVRRHLAQHLQDDSRIRTFSLGPGNLWASRFRTTENQQVVLLAVEE
ncbi:MAG: flagellar motor protein MotB [Phycisphaerae bacterium]